MASTETMTYQDSANAAYLSSSFSSLSSSRSANSLIVRTYKQSTQLYLTKQFKEALETLETIITPQPADDDINGSAANGENGSASTADGTALIAQSTRGTRTKVWVFYLSLLNAIIELGPEQGKLLFGSAAWRQLASKAREGTVWDEVARLGYAGNEGQVDAEVVVNLATLLLGHMQDQKLNQQRLETYLAASDGGGVNGRLELSQDGMSTPMSSTSSSPKQLASRLRILELYTLHVLPSNGEWDYARQFVEMNELLDEDRREQFLVALQALKEEKDGSAQRERELKEQREREMEEQRQEEVRRAEEARKAEEEKRAAEIAEKQRAAAFPTPTPAPARNGTAPSPSSSRPSSSAHSTSRPPKAQQQKKPPARSSPPPTFYRRASSMLGNVQQMVLQASRNLTNGQNSMALLRLLMFMLAFVLILARKDLRVKIRRAMENGWVKVKQTVGMGVKVSYV